MPLKFTRIEARDAIAERLATLAKQMERSLDQGNDGRIAVSDEIIGDIKLAACFIGLAEVHSVDEQLEAEK